MTTTESDTAWAEQLKLWHAELEATDYDSQQVKQVVRDLALIMDVNQHTLLDQLRGRFQSFQDSPPQCEAFTRHGHRCLRDGSRLNEYAGVMCGQHKEAYSRSVIAWVTMEARMGELIGIIDALSYASQRNEHAGDEMRKYLAERLGIGSQEATHKAIKAIWSEES